MQSLGSVPRLFSTPHAFSQIPELAEYRPLLSTTFALDSVFAGHPEPGVFQVDSFFWFLLLLLFLYFFFLLVPGGSHFSAVIATGLFAFQPATADTVNYIARRGVIMGALAVVSGFLVWFAWPRMLPDRIWVDTSRNPRNWQTEVTLKKAGRVNAMYTRFIHLPLGLYLIPVAIGMLADPAAAVFAPLLAAYIAIFERERFFRRALPAALFCGICFALSIIVRWRFDAASRIPTFAYWASEPWVAVRYLVHFFVPFGFSADSGLQPLGGSDLILTIAGLASIAALIFFSVLLVLRAKWRPVAFGILWFLIALLPSALIPGRVVEDNSRMFLPFIGLALAVTRGAWILFSEWAALPERRVPVSIAGALLAAIVLGATGYATFERNRLWESEDSLWQDAVAKNPRNERALTYYAGAMTEAGDTDRASDLLRRAAALGLHSALDETNLALAYDRLGNDPEAQRHFQSAIEDGPGYARAYSAYANWLIERQQGAEAFKMASHAVALEPDDSLGYRTLMTVHSRDNDWSDLRKVAITALGADPTDPAAQNSLLLAQSTLEEAGRVEQRTKDSPTPDDYLQLSVIYFQSKRYDESIAASRSALKLNPQLAAAWANIAAADHAMGSNDDAIAALQELLRLRPDATFARENLAYLQSLKAAK